MNWLLGLLSNPFLLTVVIAWISAQILKVVTHAFVYKEFDIKRLWGDGGMPSAHTATVCSLAAFAAISYGPASFEFAVCAIMALIVCRDAVGVRMETGKQAQIINELRSLIESKETIEIKLKEFVGHTPLQVLMGALLGIAVAIVVSIVL
jgi:acid phosphatase family membrane protein YuiD